MQGGPGDSFSKELMQLLNLPDTALVSAKTLKTVVRAVIRSQPVPGKGVRIYETPHGLTIESSGAGGLGPLELSVNHMGQLGYRLVNCGPSYPP